jgi:hypothetical protein
MLPPGSDDLEGLITQMEIMQSFITPSEMLDRMDAGEQIPEEEMYAAACQQYVDRVEERHRQRCEREREQQQQHEGEQGEQGGHEQAPSFNLPFVTQPDPDPTNPSTDADDSDFEPQDDEQSDSNGEGSAQSTGEQRGAEEDGVLSIDEPGDDLQQSMFRLHLASLTVQRDVPNRPSLHVHARCRNAAIADVAPNAPAPDVAPGDIAAVNEANPPNANDAPNAPAPDVVAPQDIAAINEANPPNANVEPRSSYRQYPPSYYNKLRLMNSYGMLFPMPDNPAYLPMYWHHADLDPTLDRNNLISFQNMVLPIFQHFLYQRQDHFMSIRTDISEEDASQVFDGAALTALSPLLYLYRTRIRNSRNDSGVGGGGGGDGGDGDDDYNDLPDDEDDEDDEEDHNMQDGMLNEINESLQKYKKDHEAWSACLIVVNSLLNSHASQGSLLRECHLDSRNTCRTFSEAMNELKKGYSVKVSS